jgi:ribosome-binding protein aMBF1 (putative translation factor)
MPTHKTHFHFFAHTLTQLEKKMKECFFQRFIKTKYLHLPNTDKSMINKSTSLGSYLRQIRENKNLLLRQVAAALEVDTAYVSKLERGEKRATKEQLRKLSEFLDIPENKLTELWLADKVMNALEGEEYGASALKLVSKRMKNK